MENASPPVAVVTGASRGAGKGIALALGEAGYVVYVTGRTTVEGTGAEGLPGTVAGTAQEVTARGGQGIPIVCDHRDDAQVAAAFEQVATEQDGRLDILVNNAIALPSTVTGDKRFWEIPYQNEMGMLDVGLRTHWVAAWHAARLMVPRRFGLIVHISSPGATTYVPGLHGPGYGAGKAGGDKMMYDMAFDLRSENVAAISLWPGLLRTERVLRNASARGDLTGVVFPSNESPEFSGRVIAAIAAAPDRMEHSGKVHYVAELAAHYGVTDIDGSVNPSFRPWLGAPTQFTDVIPTYADYLDRGGVPIEKQH